MKIKNLVVGLFLLSIIACSKNIDQHDASEIISTNKMENSDSMQAMEIIRLFYKSCDDAYNNDSVLFNNICSRNNFSDFYSLLGIDTSLIAGWCEIIDDEFKDDSNNTESANECEDCTSTILTNIAYAESITRGNLAVRIDCVGCGPVCNMTCMSVFDPRIRLACIAACIALCCLMS